MERDIWTSVFGPSARAPSWLIPTCAALMFAYYFGLIAHSEVGRSVYPELQFNSMLDHLLRGRFDVDADAVGIEGYVRDGRVYAYWGVIPALLRIVLVPIPGWRMIDVTALSCVVAATLSGVLKISAILEVRRHVPSSAFATTMVAALIVSVLFGGSNVQYLRASVYQEVVFWAAAFASAFVLFSVRGLLRNEGFSSGILLAMACSAGLALLTRVSTGLGLYAAAGLLLVWLAARRGGVAQRRFVAVTSVLLASALIAGVINQMRFGNPLIFQNVYLNVANQSIPNRIPQLEQYGIFNLSRAWYGLIYYFFPIWFLIRPDGRLEFAETDLRLIDVTEMPPSSFFVTDLILLGLSAALAWILIRNKLHIKNVDTGAMISLLTGLTIPAMLMLTFTAFTMRYRMEFYLLFDLGAYMGFFALASDVGTPNRTWTVWSAVIIGVIASHAMLLLYQLSSFGPAHLWLEQSQTDWGHVYYWRLAKMFGL